MEKEALIIKIVVDGWTAQINALNKLLGVLTDEQLMHEIATGKNRGIYLIGHLVAVHDRMIPLLGLGEQLYPELNAIFLGTPDKAVEQIPSASTLRANLTTVNELLSNLFAKMSSEEWLEKHNSVSVEDFMKEPHRNKLNVLISRTNHLANHIGQLLLLKSN
jgi:hypothetical protein